VFNAAEMGNVAETEEIGVGIETMAARGASRRDETFTLPETQYAMAMPVRETISPMV